MSSIMFKDVNHKNFFKMTNTECPICLEAVTNPVYMNCEHKVCGACWPNVRRTQNNCPLCRTPFIQRPVFNFQPGRSYTATASFREHTSPIDGDDIVKLLIMLVVVCIMSTFMWVGETCMCNQFHPGQLTKTTYHFFGGSTTISRPSFCLTYC